MVKFNKHTVGVVSVFLGLFLFKDMIEDKLDLFLSVEIRTVLAIMLVIFGLIQLNKL